MMSSTDKLRRLPARRAVLAVAALLALGACSSPKPAVQCDFSPLAKGAEAPDPTLLPMTPGTMNAVPLNAVSVIDDGIRRKVLPQMVRAGRSKTGNMTVETRLMNCTDYPLQVDARTQFLGPTRQEAEAPSAWTRLFLSPRSFASYKEYGVSGAMAQTFLVEVREGR